MIKESNSKFEKLSEKVICFQDNGYFMIRSFQSNELCPDIIDEFMATRYFSWKEEFRDKVKVTIDQVEVEVDWNFHGLYDIKLLSRDCFRAVSFEDFKKSFEDFVRKEIDPFGSFTDLQKFVKALSNSGNKFFILPQQPNTFRHKWSVFDYFHSGFVVNEKSNILTAVECGQD